MYAPNLFSHDLFALWNQTENEDKQREQARRNINGGNGNGPVGSNGVIGNSGNGGNSSVEVDSQRKQLRLLFAPPLLAYSAEYPGASLAQLEYTIQTTACFNGSYKYTTSPLIQQKIDQLEQIRNTGYSTIRPIGIEKTLQEVDYEESRQSHTSYQQLEEHSYLDTAENTNTEDHSVPTPGPREEVDLDAQIVNADESQNLDEFEDDDDDGGEGEVQFHEDEDSEMLESIEHDVSNLLHRRPLLLTLLPPQPSEHQDMFRDSMEDEGFMADEVEYQNDHSLNADSNSILHMLTNSGTTTSATNMNSGVSIATTNMTTLPSFFEISSGLPNYRRLDENSENHNENNENNENNVTDENLNENNENLNENEHHEEVDQSEMDMIIEDN